MTSECTARIGVGAPDMSLAEALSDPLIRTVMAADRVDPARLATELTRMSRRSGRRFADKGMRQTWRNRAAPRP